MTTSTAGIAIGAPRGDERGSGEDPVHESSGLLHSSSHVRILPPLTLAEQRKARALGERAYEQWRAACELADDSYEVLTDADLIWLIPGNEETTARALPFVREGFDEALEHNGLPRISACWAE